MEKTVHLLCLVVWGMLQARATTFIFISKVRIMRIFRFRNIFGLTDGKLGDRAQCYRFHVEAW